MGRLTSFLLAACLSAFALPAPAWGQQEESVYLSGKRALGLIYGVHLVTDSQAADKCWTNSGTVRAKVRLSLEQSDIQVVEEPLFAYTHFWPLAILEVVTSRSEAGICFGMAQFKVVASADTRYGEADEPAGFRVGSPASLVDEASVFLNSDNLNDQLKDFFEGAVASFAADVIANRRDDEVGRLRETMTSFHEPVTQAQYDALTQELAEPRQ